MSRKIIFLDFDGVINGGFNKILGGESGFHWWIQSAVDNINSLLEQSGAKIVVSSSWRLKENWPDGGDRINLLTNQLVWFGIKKELIDIIGITPEDLFDIEGYPAARAAEIREWLFNNGSMDDNFIVIDDQDIFLDINNEPVFDDEIKSKFVRTATKIGFAKENLDLALKLLS